MRSKLIQTPQHSGTDVYPSDYAKHIFKIKNIIAGRSLLDITLCQVKQGQASLSDAESIIANMYKYDLLPDVGIFR